VTRILGLSGLEVRRPEPHGRDGVSPSCHISRNALRARPISGGVAVAGLAERCGGFGVVLVLGHGGQQLAVLRPHPFPDLG
jgi:hypothetical protein